MIETTAASPERLDIIQPFQAFQTVPVKQLQQPEPSPRRSTTSPKSPRAIGLLGLELANLVLERLDVAESLLNRSAVAAWFPAPAVVVVDVLRLAALLGIDLEAQLALLLEAEGLENELGAAGLACAVLGLAVLTEVAPLPVAALVEELLVEAHGCWWRLGGLYQLVT